MKKVNSVEFAKAIADETRQQIMKLCCCRELSVNEIVEKTSVSQPTVSHHLAILRDVDLVLVRSEGKQTYYTLNQERFVVCCGQLMQVFAPESEATEAVKAACEC
ncbi:MAG TPA: metalloregulator ArsR/SmtB family transcription factor [Anaerolineae bacterium]|nr:metalloregulator ArsR/SmtB family transcription factor [Anaerolineae bacterium]